MSYCLNPGCSKPHNPDDARFCLTCGTRLLLGERYRATAVLGQGGFGRTLQAIDEHKPSRPVCAIKQFIPPDLAAGSGLAASKALELFYQEAERLEQLGQHSQIPELLAHLCQDQRLYLIQEFVAGLTLTQELEQQGTYSESQIWQLLADLLPVLDYIHRHQIIHRDIKPENIIRRHQDQKLVLVDFGASKFAAEHLLSQTGTVIGSAGYTAPEQLLGHPVYASDLYSLGVTCIYLLTRITPTELFDSREDQWNWRPHLQVPISRSLTLVIDQLLQRATKRRYSSAREVLAAVPQPDPNSHTHNNRTHNSQAHSANGSFSHRNGIHGNETNENRVNHHRSGNRVAATQTVAVATVSQQWRCVRTLTGHSAPLVGAVITPSQPMSLQALSQEIGQTLVSVSQDGAIKLWELSTRQFQAALGEHSGCVTAMAVSADAQTLFCGNNAGQLSLWQLEQSQLLDRLNNETHTLTSLALGEAVLASAGDRAIKLWHPQTRQSLGHLAAETTVYTLSLSPDQQTLVSGGYDGKVRIWDLKTGGLRQRLHWQLGPLQALSFSPDGRWLAGGGYDGHLKLWPTSGDVLKVLGRCPQPIRSLVFDPTGQLLACGSEDGVIRLWHLESGQLLTTLQEHAGAVVSLGFSPDGELLVSASSDQTIRLWRSVG